MDLALTYAQVAREQNPNDPNIADTLGWVYYKKNAHIKAVRLLREAAEKLQDNPVIHYHLGMVHVKRGEPKEAQKAFKTALKLSDSFPGADEARKMLNEL